jgi:hypothetical protein
MIELSDFVVKPQDAGFLHDASRAIWNGFDVASTGRGSSLVRRSSGAGDAAQERAGIVADWISVMINGEHRETLRNFFHLKYNLRKADYALKRWYADIVDDHYGVLVENFARHFYSETKLALDSYVLMSRYA